VDKNLQGVETSSSTNNTLPGAPAPGDAPSADAAPQNASSITMGAVQFVALEFDHTIEYDAYIEAEKGPKIEFAGMTTKQVDLIVIV
jgi:hypothetical protein